MKTQPLLAAGLAAAAILGSYAEISAQVAGGRRGAPGTPRCGGTVQLPRPSSAPVPAGNTGGRRGGYCPAAGGGVPAGRAAGPTSRPRLQPRSGVPGPTGPRTGRAGANRPSTGGPERPKTAPTTPIPVWLLPQTLERASQNDWTQWWVWWSFNRDAYLSVRGELERRPTSPVETRPGAIGRHFELHARPVFDRMTREGDMVEILREMLIAGARANPRAILDRHVRFSAQHFGKLQHDELKEAALLSLGIRGGASQALDLLEVFADSPEGRQYLDVSEVSIAARCMAAYALGMASEDLNDGQRTNIARVLMEATSHEEVEIRNAAIQALGHVELPPCIESNDDGPHTCPGSQTGSLVDAYLDPTSPFVLRSMALTAIARVAADFEGDDQRGSIADLLIEATRQDDQELVASATLALGLYGDGDDDAADTAVREQLVRLIEKGPKDSRGLAMISLAQVSSRRVATESLKEATSVLLQQLARGRGDAKSWAAIALGVLGHRLALSGRAIDDTAVFGLRERLYGARSPGMAAACSIGLALVRDESEATKKLFAKRYSRSKDPFFRSYAALALGVLNVDAAQEDLNEAVLEGDLGAAVALRILGEDEVVPELAARLADPEIDKTPILQVLGRLADPRAIAPLSRVMSDKALKPAVRAQATRALGQLVDESFAHWTAPYANDLNYRALTWSLSDPTTQRGLLDFRPRE